MIADWWNSREPRERILLFTLAGLIALMTLIYGVWQPLVAARSNAVLAVETASADARAFNAGLSRLTGARVSSGQDPALDVDGFRVSLTQSARAAGLTIERLQNGQEGTVQITFADADPKLLFAWLVNMQQEPGGAVTSASMSGQHDRVQAVIELQGARS